VLAAAFFVGLIALARWEDRRSAAGTSNLGSQPGASTGTGTAPGFALREISHEAGIDFVHRSVELDPQLANILPHVAGMGAAVSVADFDDDGWPDLYATSSASGSPNALYRNRRDGTFEDVAAAAGVADVNRAGEGASMGSVWADFDNDGREDLFLYKWGWPQLFRNRGPQGNWTFEDVTEAAGLRRWMNSNAAVWLDYDRDGLVDLYVAGYFSEKLDLWKLSTTRIMQESFEFANNGGHNYLYRNLGGGRFEDVTARTGCDSTRWTLAVASADFDGDGWPDLYLANDYGPEELFLNQAGKGFALRKDALEDRSKSGMCVALGDCENNGTLAIYVTNISRAPFLFQGNNLRLNRMASSGKLFNVARDEVANCGWAWGAQFGDLDRDGHQDLYVVNGFISASREREYWYDMAKIAGAQGDLFLDARNWPQIGDKSLSGYERSRVLVQREGKMRDVAEAVGALDERDGRAVALADLFNRGALDVVIANQKGPLLVYRNEPAPGRHWIEFHLRGRKSNRSAIGAQLTLEFAGQRQVQVVAGGLGFCSQNDRRLFFGLGETASVERALVLWPSGVAQTVEGPDVDRLHTLEEPEQ
jgi:enediyne biosynthesis protein E4